MPSAIKTAAQYGDDLAVIFVECQGAEDKDAARFAWEHKWMGTTAMWTSERPFTTGSRGLPNFALVSSTGEVLMKGHPGSMHGKIIETIEAEIEANKKGPKDAPKALKKSYKALGKKQYAKAIEAANEVVAAGGEDAESAKALATEIERRVARDFERVDAMLSEGMVLEAEALFETLEKGVKGSEAFAETLASAKEAVDGADMKAAKSLEKLLAMLHKSGPDDATIKKLTKFVSKNESGPVAERAQGILDLLQG